MNEKKYRIQSLHISPPEGILINIGPARARFSIHTKGGSCKKVKMGNFMKQKWPCTLTHIFNTQIIKSRPNGTVLRGLF